MTFQELVAELKKQRLRELRDCSEDYFEAVVSTADLAVVESVLTTYFGVPMKPAGVQASGDAGHFSKPYGGIQKNQTMYFLQKEGGNELALLWPWGNGTLVTLKIIVEGKPKAPQEEEAKSSEKKSFWESIWGR